MQFRQLSVQQAKHAGGIFSGMALERFENTMVLIERMIGCPRGGSCPEFRVFEHDNVDNGWVL
jgi:hypothetical protein